MELLAQREKSKPKPGILEWENARKPAPVRTWTTGLSRRGSRVRVPSTPPKFSEINGLQSTGCNPFSVFGTRALSPSHSPAGWVAVTPYQRRSRRPKQAPAAVGMSIPTTYQTARKGASVSMQENA